jgi:hypothetical protein
MGSAPILLFAGRGRAVLAAAAIAAVAASPQPAPGTEDGEAAYAAALELLDHHDAAARQHLLAAGHAGHARAAATLGTMALLSPEWAGEASPETFSRFWLRRAARAGDPGARHLLASMQADAVRTAHRRETH